MGSLDAPHTMSYLPDIAAGPLTLPERTTPTAAPGTCPSPDR